MHLPQPGENFLGRFAIDREIGAGGFARVYRATDSAGRPVALKVLLPDSAEGYSREVIARFGREARTLSMLRDPHTVQMFDSGQAPDGLLFMVFELVPGMDLEELLAREGKLETWVAIKILRQVLLSLKEAHGHGLLHRDIKPQNIRVYQRGNDPYAVKLLDFGIARHVSGADHTKITRTGQLVGTPRYMSPEQLLDKPLGPSSDIYSVGLLMLECVAGSDVMHGNEWSDQLQRLHSGQLAAMPTVGTVDPHFMAVLNRMTEREQAYRYQSVDAVLRALDTMGTNAGTSSQTLGSGVRPPLERVAREPMDPRMKWLLGGLGVAVVVLAVVAIVMALRVEETGPNVVHVVHTSPSIVQKPASPDKPTVVRVKDEPAAPEVEEPVPEEVTSGCGLEVRKGMLTDHAVVGLSTVDYITYVPPSYSGEEQVPLLILLHPDHTQPDTFLRTTRFDIVSDKKGFIVLAPTVGERAAWTEAEHIDLVVSLVEEVKRRYCIDEKRIFAVGHNNAGKGIQRLSCKDFLTAAATNSFRPRVRERWCASNPSKPILTLNPLHTDHMPVEGGTNCYGSNKLSLAEWEEYWKERNHCRGKAKPYFQSEESICQTWECDREFVSCHIDGGLGWPGSPTRVFADFNRCDGEPPEFPTEDVIWKFFEEVAAGDAETAD